MDEGITSWDLKNRIPHQKLRIYSNSEDYRSESRSKYLKKYAQQTTYQEIHTTGNVFPKFRGLDEGIKHFGPQIRILRQKLQKLPIWSMSEV